MHTFAAEIRKRLFYQHFVFMFNRFTTTRFLLLSVTVLTLLTSCEQKVTYQIQDDILFTLLDPNNVEGMEQRGDSLYKAGQITDLSRKFYHAYPLCNKYHHFNDAVPIFREIIKEGSEDSLERLFQICAASELTMILRYQGHIENAMLTAIDATQKFSLDEAMTDQTALESYIRLNTFIGDGLVSTGNYDEADKQFQKFYNLSKDMKPGVMRLAEWYPRQFELFEVIIRSYIVSGQYERALPWIERCEQDAEDYYKSPEFKDMPHSTTSFVEGYLAGAQICKAVAFEHLGKPEEAKEAYHTYLKSDMAHTILGRFNRAFYLSASKHYKEAADVFQHMDNVLAMYSPSISLDWIHEYYLPKFEANLHAGRRDSAFVQAEQICENLDSTLTTYMHDEGGKLATIYASLKKEEKIIEQEERIGKQRTLGLSTLILLLGGFFGTYTVRSKRHARRIAEVRAEQERIENELSIAREIQMSMVPHNFPQHSGLDMYALMEPAKEVGGDLYGYVFNKNKLYFAVGDVSGKGIPASLFMAQVTRLFHTLADEGLMPNQICTIMNKELSGEDNVNGMFVTMFIGMLDIETGHLDFCNAGHNPPIIGCGEKNARFLEIESNAPIGLWPDLEYIGEEIDDIKNRTLLVYSDGLNEAENLEQKQFGDDHLMDILSTSQFASSQHLISRLQTEVEKHRNGAAPNDDLTMFCLRLS